MISCSKMEEVESIDSSKANTSSAIDVNKQVIISDEGSLQIEKVKSDNIKTGGGEFIYGNGWTGWLDPDLIESDIPENEIFKEDAKFKGGFIYDENNQIMGISCPE